MEKYFINHHILMTLIRIGVWQWAYLGHDEFADYKSKFWRQSLTITTNYNFKTKIKNFKMIDPLKRAKENINTKSEKIKNKIFCTSAVGGLPKVCDTISSSKKGLNLINCSASP